MQAKELLKTNLKMGTGNVLRLLEDMKDAPLTFPTPAGGCHSMWVLGHLTYADAQFVHEWVLGEPNPLADWKDIFAGGTEAVADADVYPPFETVLEKSRETREKALEVLDSLSEADLDTPSKNVPEPMQKYFGTYGQVFSMMANHWWMHRGNVADCRRAARGESPGK